MDFIQEIYFSNNKKYGFSVEIPFFSKNYDKTNLISTDLKFKISFNPDILNNTSIYSYDPIITNEGVVWEVSKNSNDLIQFLTDFFEYSYYNKFNLINIHIIDFENVQERILIEKLLTNILNQKELINNIYIMKNFFEIFEQMSLYSLFPDRIERFNLTVQEVLKNYKLPNEKLSFKEEKSFMSKTTSVTSVCFKDSIVCVAVEYNNDNINQNDSDEEGLLNSGIIKGVKNFFSSPFNFLSDNNNNYSKSGSTKNSTNGNNKNTHSFTENNSYNLFNSEVSHHNKHCKGEIFLFGVDNAEKLNPIINLPLKHRVKTLKLINYGKEYLIIAGCDDGIVYLLDLNLQTTTGKLQLDVKSVLNINEIVKNEDKSLLANLDLNNLNGYMYIFFKNSNKLSIVETNYNSLIQDIQLTKTSISFIKMNLEQEYIIAIDKENTLWILQITKNFKVKILSSVRNKFGDEINPESLSNNNDITSSHLKNFSYRERYVTFLEVNYERRLLYISNNVLEVFICEYDDPCSFNFEKEFEVRELKRLKLAYPLSMGVRVSNITLHGKYNKLI